MTGLEVGFFSIPVLDIDKAKSFYSESMGWKFQERDPNFVYIFVEEKMIGALEAATDSFRPSNMGPLMYFRADSMKTVLERVNRSGGTILEQTAIQNGENGYTARVQDPFKNAIAFWAPEQ